MTLKKLKISPLSSKIMRTEILAGLTVALALVPEAIAFAFVAGVDPLVGLYAAFMVGLITSTFGGRPGMISGATGGLAVVMVHLVSEHGVEYLFAAVILMGVIQIIIGLLKLGKFVRMIPHSVMLGFVNGLAIVIFIAQLAQFKVADTGGKLVWMTGSNLYIMLGLVALTMIIIYTAKKFIKSVPAPLIAIIIVTILVGVFGIQTKTVGDIASVGGGLPKFGIPMVPLTLETLKIILPHSLIFAIIGLIESLMTLTLVDEITETKGDGNKECLGQGFANLVTGFFGGMGGCAMIGQSMINVESGARRRLSGISAGLFLLGFILFGAALIEIIPIAVLVGVMFVVSISTFEWSSFRIAKSIPKSDLCIIILVSVVTVFVDLAIAVISGVIVASLVFAWEKGKRIDIDKHMEGNTRIYALRGALFFGSVRNFIDAFDTANDAKDVVIDFSHARIFDHSAIEAINTVTAKYKKNGKTIHLRNLSTDCFAFIQGSKDIMEVNIIC
ncbi:SulP family inorganic anion transporter [Vallitalea guaymasensis]|uniref:SulP family inorganic anion transporter n=1 Tax=Vallitalea guaymasensis TaxID=1185412 RepID=A0A8J8MDL5_9FIRM|nr:SulP family inorganic anion transporter [Vallitalea guaymasensis]QUH30933.1 SulP family inorganic anion transporter [Vallitalea guaymasensis]